MPLYLCEADGTHICSVRAGDWFKLPNGDVASPAQAGYAHPLGWKIVDVAPPPEVEEVFAADVSDVLDNL